MIKHEQNYPSYACSAPISAQIWADNHPLDEKRSTPEIAEKCNQIDKVTESLSSLAKELREKLQPVLRDAASAEGAGLMMTCSPRSPLGARLEGMADRIYQIQSELADVLKRLEL